jgi:hypothetical protein
MEQNEQTILSARDIAESSVRITLAFPIPTVSAACFLAEKVLLDSSLQHFLFSRA